MTMPEEINRMVTDAITKDAARTLAQSNTASGGATMLQRTGERQSFWKKLVGG